MSRRDGPRRLAPSRREVPGGVPEATGAVFKEARAAGYTGVYGQVKRQVRWVRRTSLASGSPAGSGTRLW